MSGSNSRKRNLPSWIASREEGNDGSEERKQPVDRGKLKMEERIDSGTGSGDAGFSRLMEGIVFVLSGFVNPERGDLRSHMLEMGAEYQPDWNANCTLLVCAFGKTPKFRQVEADGGTIISKDWISECYNQRKLVDIEPYLLHAGKPWRRQSISDETKDVKPPKPVKHLNQEKKGSHSTKATAPSKDNNIFFTTTPIKAKKWAIEDLVRTISWLESQEEKPEPRDIRRVAAEGIITCIQDAIDALKEGKDVTQIIEQWSCLPRVVEELGRINNRDGTGPTSKEALCREAMACKQIYELEFLNAEHDDIVNMKIRQRKGSSKKGKTKEKAIQDEPSYDSDSTVEMTEEEIDRAFNSIASSLQMM